MNFKRKNILLKLLFPIFIIILTIFLLTKFTLSKNLNPNEQFNKFMDLYKSKNISMANELIIDSNVPDINNVFLWASSKSSDYYLTEMISSIENALYSINYEIISTKTFLNKSKLNINFTYSDISKCLIDFIKNNDYLKDDYKNFILSMQNEKFKIRTNLDIEMIRKNNKWYIVLSKKLINILTSGLYKNFTL